MTFASHQLEVVPVTKTIRFTPPLAELIAKVIDHALTSEASIDLTTEEGDVLAQLSKVLMDDGQ